MNATNIGACAITLNFIARLFIEAPDADFIARIDQNKVFEQWPLATKNPDAAEALQFLSEGVKDHDNISQAALSAEYTALFVGPENAVPLWESVWTTKDKLLFDGPMFEVRDAYAAYDLASPDPSHEPDDHFGLEVSFLGGVMGCAAQSAQEGDIEAAGKHFAAAGEFMNNHLSRWAGRFLEATANHEHSSFYKAVSILCADTLAQAADLLQPSRA
jgi:TorA maturation chaperone TorD